MSYKWVTTPVMSNPAGAFAKALFVPVAGAYVRYVVDKANNIHYSTLLYDEDYFWRSQNVFFYT